ncbi:replicative DNA helicase [Bordetella bronchiseptica]|uniref:replicative DNA helicase n=1 Tax=Bordetella bronchiseptica TaxID=518 RepID=UPI00049EEF6F|nr:replicative DNA helicase [Bordetella bronchiseptica]KDB58300.1 replicative DNA helicase [Bordetella bronchiseptica A1-7]KDB73043.1 replicative DNA helicase [Bordetella bronchiseptica B20-10725633]
MNATTVRVPPHSVDAEQGVLGGLLLDNRAWDRLGDLLTAEDFYRHDHRLIFGTAAALLNASKPADVLTIHDALQAAGQSEAAGGLAYLNAIADSVPSSANVRSYAEIVRAHRVRRDVLAVGHDIAELAEAGDPAELVERATGMVMALVDTRAAGRDPVAVGSLLTTVIEQLEARVERGGSLSGLATGFADLDERTSGLQIGDLIIVAGRPSMGKTTFAINIAENVTDSDGVALVISLEMAGSQLAERTIARYGEIDTQRLRTGRLQDGDWPRLTHAVQKMENQRLIIADDPGLANVSRVRLAARKVKQRQGRLDLIVIDYLQLMQGEGNNRNEDLGGITRALKLLARELACPIVLLSQLSRKVEERTNKRPILSDLRESGAIEQDADVVMMVYRDDYYNEDSPFKGLSEILIRKQRMGPLGEVFMTFQGQYSRFLDADQHAVAEARNVAATKPKTKYSMLRD